MGYTKDKKSGELVIVPEQAEIVRRIFRIYLEGSSIIEITRALEEDKIKTVTGKDTWHPGVAIRKLKLLGIGVYFEKENINTLSEKSEQMLTILSSIAQTESENISANTKWGFRKQFEDGTFIRDRQRCCYALLATGLLGCQRG